MSEKLHPSIKSAAILCLILGFALSVAWAATYSGSSTVTKGGRGGFYLVNGKSKVNISIDQGALDDYLTEQGLDSVEITADLEEEWVDTGDGNGYYQLTFEFGPSGAYFNPGLLLTLTGKYAENPEVQLYDENGEALPSERNDHANRATFRIPHLSSYYYDDDY